jgi:hypothetical protein
MPMYQYYCERNGESVEVVHSMREIISTWGELCEAAGRPLGETPRETSVERILYPVGVSSPQGNSKLKELGFTKLVKRDEGVYENVTAADGEKRYMKRGDASSLPSFHKKIRD